MNTAFIYLVSFILVLGILVTVHEFGHFWVARKLGVRVLKFSIGFGNPIWSRKSKIDDTEYVIAAIPLGGYVKMLGEQEEELSETEKKESFSHKPPVARIAISAAGPVFNFLLAILVFWAMYLIGVPGLKPSIGDIKPDSVAQSAGFQSNDQIIRIDGRKTPTWENARIALFDGILDHKRLAVDVLDESGHERTRYLDLTTVEDPVESDDMLDSIGLTIWQPPAVLGEIEPDGAAQRAGLLEHDRIVRFNDKPIQHWIEWVDLVRKNPNQEVNLLVNRAGELISIVLMPDAIEIDGEISGSVGVHIPKESLEKISAKQKYGLLESFVVGLEKTWDMSILMLRVLYKVVTGDASLKNISGPITIAQYAGESASLGLIPFLSFLAIVSVSLGVLNLMPIPILDGGHILYYLIEIVKGSPVSDQTQIAGQKVGILLLVALMGLAFYNDFMRLLG